MSVTHDEYRRARYIVEPAAAALLDIVRPDKRGRPTLHPVILLTGMFLAIQKYGMATISSTYAILTIDLPRELQWDLGVLSGPAHKPRQIAEHQLYKLSRRINPHLDHSRKRAASHSRDVRLQRRSRLDALSTLILAQTLLPRPAGSVDYALDGTGFDASERGVKKPAAVKELEGHEESLSAAELAELNAAALSGNQADQPQRVGRGSKGPTDAAWGKRTGKYGGRETYWGYDVEALIAVPRIGEKGPRRDEPSMVVRLVAIPASTDIVGPCLRMIDSMMAEGIPRRKDRAAATLRRAVRQPPKHGRSLQGPLPRPERHPGLPTGAGDSRGRRGAQPAHRDRAAAGSRSAEDLHTGHRDPARGDHRTAEGHEVAPA